MLPLEFMPGLFKESNLGVKRVGVFFFALKLFPIPSKYLKIWCKFVNVFKKC